MSMNTVDRAPDMVLRDLQCRLYRSEFVMTRSGFPIVKCLGHRILWKGKHNRFEVYSGHRDSGNSIPLVFASETALLLHFDELAKRDIQVQQAPDCPYCGRTSMLHDKQFVYGAGYAGKMYVCAGYPACDSYVGANADTFEPLGSLAQSGLREKRARAHAVFDPLWRSKTGALRLLAYQCAANVMGVDKFHIGTANELQCDHLVDSIDEITALLATKLDVAKLALYMPRPSGTQPQLQF